MRRINFWTALLFVFLMLLLVPAFAQAPADTPPAETTAADTGTHFSLKTALDKIGPDYRFEIYAGAGRLMTAGAGNALAYKAEYETNFQVGGRVFLSPRLSVNLNVTRDTVHLGEWLYTHKFIKTEGPEHAYQYTKVSPSIEYWFGDLYVFAGAPLLFSPNDDIESKIGIEAGAGVNHTLYKKLFWQTELRYIHCKDFIVPQANAVNLSFAIGYKF